MLNIMSRIRSVLHRGRRPDQLADVEDAVRNLALDQVALLDGIERDLIEIRDDDRVITLLEEIRAENAKLLRTVLAELVGTRSEHARQLDAISAGLAALINSRAQQVRSGR